ncbi:PREDICTED: putative fatty acyl-CoA reductase CG5065 isoform X2 [Dinoponera quadriceps]|uniref:Fatty acyl-CoA reductase n=1 Tax=Dinoponera quadriceps TaxID=609295 RepID=A0A6P3Y882_DINQU|nr:PREDICTED: putative fatty acyl-CoA reductase CG5065 isoform X2 [Dinoponera quadriceps]
MGVLGNILIEKLLQSCPDVSKIYLMVCSKKKTRAPRLGWTRYFIVPYSSEGRELSCKIVPVVGELYEIDLGFTKGDTDLLTHEISLIFHFAASIRFNNDIKSATTLNVVGRRAVLDLAKRMPNLNM